MGLRYFCPKTNQQLNNSTMKHILSTLMLLLPFAGMAQTFTLSGTVCDEQARRENAE